MLLSHIASDFKARRDAILKAQPGGVFLFSSAEELLRNPDVTFPFRQESNFFYLTGFEEPESFVVVGPGKNKAGSHLTLFVRKKDADREMWEGERYGVEGARQVFGADEAYTIDELDRRLPELLAGAEKVYYRVGQHEVTDRRVLSALESHRRSLGRSGKSLVPIADPNEVVGELRLFKSASEIETMRKVCRITAGAHRASMQQVKPGWNEFEVEALIDYDLRRHGCQRVGYGSIVAGGVNAACLHYRFNNQPLKDGDLLLIDAGGELDYYTADITRTFPIGKKFNSAQAKAYDLVLKSQKEGIAMSKPGVTLPAIHKHVTDVLVDGLLSLGLLKGNRDEIIKAGQHRRFYPHNTSHWLGMDVHDVGLYLKNGEPRKAEPGMVFTIEPGFYVQPADKDAPAEYHHIGIRIEDDILITDGGHEVLTRDVPKERDEIEALRPKS